MSANAAEVARVQAVERRARVRLQRRHVHGCRRLAHVLGQVGTDQHAVDAPVVEHEADRRLCPAARLSVNGGPDGAGTHFLGGHVSACIHRNLPSRPRGSRQHAGRQDTDDKHSDIACCAMGDHVAEIDRRPAGGHRPPRAGIQHVVVDLRSVEPRTGHYALQAVRVAVGREAGIAGQAPALQVIERIRHAAGLEHAVDGQTARVASGPERVVQLQKVDGGPVQSGKAPPDALLDLL